MSRSVGSIALRAAAASLAVGLLASYSFAWSDLLINGQVSSGVGAILLAIPESVRYWALHVLPYWWFVIVILVAFSTALAAIGAVAASWIARKWGAV